MALGFGESWVGTGSATWAIARVGPLHTARVISWNGIATYGALALGAPLGVLLEKHWSMGALGGAVLLLGLAGGLPMLPRLGVWRRRRGGGSATWPEAVLLRCRLLRRRSMFAEQGWWR